MTVTRRLPLALLVLALLAAPGALAGAAAGVGLRTASASGRRAVPAVPAARRTLEIGVGDQTPKMFSDPRFLRLGIRIARLSVAWDTLEVRWQRAQLAVWLRAAQADGVAPLISFDHSRRPGRSRHLPTPGQFAHEFRTFRALYPWVRDFASWNEANFCGEATCHAVATVVAYYRTIRRLCPSCHVLGAELLDLGNMTGWAQRFRRILGSEPPLWGLHNYIGANRLQAGSTRALLGAVRGNIWFTETGGLVSRRNHPVAQFPQSAAHAARVTRFVLGPLAHLSPRITRVYIYQWNGDGPRAPWDSGLIAPGGRTRPAFAAFVADLHAFGAPAGSPPPS